MVNYNQRLVEVDVILNHLSDSDYNKIPQEVIRAIKDNMDKEYTWELDKSKPLEEQELSRDTIAFLSYINMEYLLNDEQKQLMGQIHKLNEKNFEQENAAQYKEELFKNDRQKEKNDEIYSAQKKELIKYEEKFYKKIINKLKSFFNIKGIANFLKR